MPVGLTAISGLSANTYSCGGEVSRSGEGEGDFGGGATWRLRGLAAKGAAAPAESLPPLRVSVFLTTVFVDSSALEGTEDREEPSLSSIVAEAQMRDSRVVGKAEVASEPKVPCQKGYYSKRF